MLLLFISISLQFCYGKEITLFAGLEKWAVLDNMAWNHTPTMWDQLDLYFYYSQHKMITSSSILVYYINTNGDLAIYPGDKDINSEHFQSIVQTHTGLKSYPTLFCDETIGACEDLSTRLKNVYKKKDKFISDTIEKALKYGWNGYYVDFESYNPIDVELLNNFIISWAKGLQYYNLTLHLWIGFGDIYNISLLKESKNIKFSTMDTYSKRYDDFTSLVEWYLRMNISMEFGFLTDVAIMIPSINKTEFSSIIDWLYKRDLMNVNIWSSIIPDHWMDSLYNY